MYDLYQNPLWLVSVILIIILWTIIWKGLGLWFAAKNKQKGWFVVLLVFNTFGVLPLIYLLWNRPKSKQEENKIETPKKQMTTKQITIKKKPKELVLETKKEKEVPKLKVTKKKEVKKKKIKSKQEVSLNEEMDEMSMQL
tara:strand:- start:139 stop:558 length:420 start_codon:yes stop_codon:yes gene_type:complete